MISLSDVKAAVAALASVLSSGIEVPAYRLLIGFFFVLSTNQLGHPCFFQN